jgi:5-methylcytosine-specific restriction endonuclease McrA
VPRQPGAWGSNYHQRLSRAVLARDWDPDLGYTPCHWCGKPASTADHWPIGRDEGGPDTLANLVAACRPCNASRGARYVQGKRATPRQASREW